MVKREIAHGQGLPRPFKPPKLAAAIFRHFVIIAPHANTCALAVSSRCRSFDYVFPGSRKADSG
jgi:hypothetical protein